MRRAAFCGPHRRDGDLGGSTGGFGGMMRSSVRGSPVRRVGAMFASTADSSGEPNARSRSRVDGGHRDLVVRRRSGW